MDIETFAFAAATGWSRPLPTHLDSPGTLVLVFGSPTLDSVAAPLAELAAGFPRACLMGCSTAGEILDTSLRDDGLVVAVSRFARTPLKEAHAPVAEASSSYGAGVRLARELLRPDLEGVLVLSEGLAVNGSELVRGLNEVLPPAVVVTGGLAGDGSRFTRTWVLAGREARTRHASAVGFYGDAVTLGHGSKGGWDPFGVERRVTRSAGNVLYELNNRPALALYKEYLGQRATGLPATGLLFPLSLRQDRAGAESVVRTILGIDEATQSITFAGDIPEGSLVTLMHATFERLIDGASDAAAMVGARAGDAGQTLAIAISCVGRRLVLGERSEEEIEATLDGLPANTRQIGFYSYGEISPLVNGICDLHNQTMTLTTISETA